MNDNYKFMVTRWPSSGEETTLKMDSLFTKNCSEQDRSHEEKQKEFWRE